MVKPLRGNDQCVQWERVAQGHDSAPSAASLDFQSVKIGIPTEIAVGYDGGKHIKGRKRHLMVDTLGLVMMVVVTATNISDPKGARLLFERFNQFTDRIRRLVLIWDEMDPGYLSLGSGDDQALRRGQRICSFTETLGGGANVGLAQLIGHDVCPKIMRSYRRPRKLGFMCL
jgi:hypothetical protein